MKLNLGKRLILFLHWLASLILLAMIAAPSHVEKALTFANKLPEKYQQILLIVLLTVYLLLSLAVICIIFKRNSERRAERGFITVDSADTGKVRIAMSAIEQMVKQAVYTVDGISDMKISLSNADDAIAITVNIVMVNGSHVPTVTLNMQRAIRQYVELSCGVAVRSVSVNIQSVAPAPEGGKRNKRAEAKVAMPAYPAEETVAVPADQPTVVPEYYEETPELQPENFAVPVYSDEPSEEPMAEVAAEPDTEENKEN